MFLEFTNTKISKNPKLIQAPSSLGLAILIGRF